jgi:hypothetical protein
MTCCIKIIAQATVVITMLSLPFGCGDNDLTDTFTNTITCADVCERYRDCFDGDYDVAACTSSCEDDATAEEQKEERLEACDACLDDTSCAAAIFSCPTECAGFVP